MAVSTAQAEVRGEGRLLERVGVGGASLALSRRKAAPLRCEQAEDLVLLCHQRRLPPLRTLPLLADLSLHPLLEEARLMGRGDT